MSWVWVEEIEDGVKIGYRDRKNTAKKWWVRIYYPQFRRYKEKALFLDYEDNKASYRSARKAARAVFAEVREGREAGDHPHAQRTVQMVADLYEKKTLEWGRENDRLKNPKHRIHGSRIENTFWTEAKAKSAKNILNHLRPYWATLKEQNFRKVEEKHFKGFIDWALKNHPDWSPSWTNRVITQIRMVWLFGEREGWTNLERPRIPRRAEDLRERSRRALKAEEWFEMVRWARDRWESIEPSNQALAHRKDAALQFWCWLNFVSWTGFRPPSGAVEKNLPRWEDIRTTEDGKRLLSRRDKVKGGYECPISPRAYKFLDFLKKTQEDKGMGDCPWVFAHTKARAGSHNIGDPIKSFKKQWEIMLRELGYWEEWGTSPTDKLVPYSLRGFAITMAIREGVPAITLARSLGTSVRMLEQTYYNFLPEAEFDTLVRMSGSEIKKAVKYDKNGYPILS